MPLSREMQRLRAEHAALVTLSRIILGMTASPSPPGPDDLASARGQLREALVRHLKCEDWILYPRLMATGDAELMRITREFEIEMGSLAADFAAYDEKWTRDRVAADWAGFRRETKIVFDLLAMRIEREERELYPLADTLYASAAVLGPPVMDGSTISS
ncbi:Hemerythrin HHE cation binding domain-containing protein [Sphingopyxis sp. LC363]|nr:Hemerythrin HHE cation binding domain-containing protein [Sphingopyxis sp. LC363]